MKRPLALLLACWAGVAAADPSNPCGAPASAIKVPYADVASSTGGFQCAPSPVGSGTLPTLRSNAAGTLAWWYCPSASGKWQLNWAAATAASLSASNVLAEVSAVVTAADPIAAFHAVAAQNVKLPVNDSSLTPVWCPFAAEMVAGAPAAVVRPRSVAVLKPDSTVSADADHR